jgi:hypothetical protein
VFGIDPEECEDLVIDFADRAGRNLADYDRNPHWHRISTISGLIEFLCAQPRAQGV